MVPRSLFSPAGAAAGSRFGSLLPLLLVGAYSIAAQVTAVAQPDDAPFNERPAEATVIISNSHWYEGTFSLSTVARVCGELPAELNFSGLPSFVVQFYPESGQGPIHDITFSSNELVGGVTTSSSFFLSTIVYGPSIGSPPAYVLDTSRPEMTGTATLMSAGPGTQELKIDGVNDMNEAIQLSLKCGPRGEG